jgi:class 3 adenylate cyclase
MATEESHLGDDALFAHAAELVEGLSRLRAEQLETVPSMLCVLDRASARRIGGTYSAYERWSQMLGPPDVIDLHALREAVLVQDRSHVTLDEGERANAASGVAGAPGERPRSWKSLMFADFAGFSNVHDAFAPQFHERFLDIAARQIADSTVQPLDAKTWGDGLYVVFESQRDAADFALGFLERTLGVDWTAAGLPSTSRIRIALHAGPVFRGFDPVMHREHFFGASVTRAARIEPVTQPGTVYASEAFAATLAATGQEGFVLEYIGRLPLAKAYGESTIYRLDRA